MPILPVIDLKQGQVVRGIAGRRAEYKPIVSKLTDSARPLDVARAFRCHFGFNTMYLADLDAIEGCEPAAAIYESLRNDGFYLWVDAGVRTASDARRMRELKVNSVVVGLETVEGPETLASVCRDLSDQLVFSLDLKNGRPLGNQADWKTDDAWSIAQRAIGLGVSRLVVLDLARVGAGGGPGTEAICSQIRREYPYVEITAGGGVRGIDDIRMLLAAGANRVLVASRLHDWRIIPEDLASL
jgi:phosphoribosylformimino-5-aminoimidazole carboxamide ribotide isomerase